MGPPGAGAAAPLRTRLERLLGQRMECADVLLAPGVPVRLAQHELRMACHRAWQRREAILVVAEGRAGRLVVESGPLDVTLLVTTSGGRLTWCPGRILPRGQGRWLHLGWRWPDHVPGARHAPLDGPVWTSAKAAAEIAWAWRAILPAG